MKCKSCGSNLNIQDTKCMYCGTANPHYQKHREYMFHLKKDYEQTKDKVIRKSHHFANFTVKTTLIAVLVAVDILLLFLASNSWSIMHSMDKAKAEKQADMHRKILEQYEAEKNYIELAKYYDEHSLYGSEKLEDYDTVYRLCSNFSYCYGYIVELGKEDAYFTDEQRIKYISENLEYLYDSMEQKEYDLPEAFSGSHKELIEHMKYDLQVLLITYAHITEEEAANFHNISDGRRQVAMERGLGLYEN